MSLEGNLEYALARVQCQYGTRPSQSDWGRLEASHDLGQYLELARSSIFGPWIVSLDRSRDAHAIERTLRAAWRNYVRRVAAWHPRCWQRWLNWLEWLPTLGLITQLGRPDPAPEWLLTDPVVGPVSGGTRAERLAAVQHSALAVFEPAIRGQRPLADLWLARWRGLCPPVDDSTGQLMASLAKAMRQYTQGLAREGADAARLRGQLRQRLERLFRAGTGTPVAALCHLALMALDFERLRGGLVNRALFGRSG